MMKELKRCLDNKTFLPAQQNLLKIQDRLNILTSARSPSGVRMGCAVFAIYSHVEKKVLKGLYAVLL